MNPEKSSVFSGRPVPKRCGWRGTAFQPGGTSGTFARLAVSNPKNEILANPQHSPAPSQWLHAFLGHPESEWPGCPGHQARVLSFELRGYPFLPTKKETVLSFLHWIINLEVATFLELYGAYVRLSNWIEPSNFHSILSWILKYRSFISSCQFPSEVYIFWTNVYFRTLGEYTLSHFAATIIHSCPCKHCFSLLSFFLLATRWLTNCHQVLGYSWDLMWEAQVLQPPL